MRTNFKGFKPLFYSHFNWLRFSFSANGYNGETAEDIGETFEIEL
jgi:hypothetical protein